MTSFKSDPAAPLASLAYPRTGKRGVPQQFPRRLYEMLESEAKLATTDLGHQNIISWSDSGEAFRIVNVALFASRVLPKYFRTSKFSSFQRNLNLYGFAKVRRGPDSDMYAHPSFVRGQPDTLSHLRKCNSTTARKRVMGPPDAHITAAPKIITPVHTPDIMRFPRAVTPSSPTLVVEANQQQTTNFSYHHIVPMPTATIERVTAADPQLFTMPTLWHHQGAAPPQHLQMMVTVPPPQPQHLQMMVTPVAPVSPGGSDSGRLDLLTMACLGMAKREAINITSATAVPAA